MRNLKKLSGIVKQTGVTIEGNPVWAGAFYMADTMGLPLPVLFMSMQMKGLVPDAPDFVNSALSAGWKHKTIKDRMREAYQDSYGNEFWKGVDKTVSIHFDWWETDENG